MKVGFIRLGQMGSGLVRDRFPAALARGLGEADWCAIARLSYQNAGLENITE